MKRLSEFYKYPFVVPDGIISTPLVLALVITAIAFFAPASSEYQDNVLRLSAKVHGEDSGKNLVTLFAAIFSGSCFIMSVSILLTSLPIYLFSSDPERVKRAGGLVKSTLGFILGSGGAVATTLSFK